MPGRCKVASEPLAQHNGQDTGGAAGVISLPELQAENITSACRLGKEYAAFGAL